MAAEKQILCDLNKFPKENIDLFKDFGIDLAEKIWKFHQTIPGYKATPLISLSNLAKKLGVKDILVKDESKRFNLNAYKFLGVSYSLACQIGKAEGEYLFTYNFSRAKRDI